MTNKLIGGKKPLSEKKNFGPQFEELSFDGSDLHLPNKFMGELKRLGFEFRFIHSGEYRNAQNTHRRGWKVFKRSDFQENGSDIMDYGFGLDGFSPAGTVERKEMVLAIRPIEHGDKHRQYLKDKADRQSGDYNKRVADEMRQKIKQTKSDVRIYEGFDENE